jgi:hypothetical protein
VGAASRCLSGSSSRSGDVVNSRVSSRPHNWHLLRSSKHPKYAAALVPSKSPADDVRQGGYPAPWQATSMAAAAR